MTNSRATKYASAISSFAVSTDKNHTRSQSPYCPAGINYRETWIYIDEQSISKALNCLMKSASNVCRWLLKTVKML